MSEFFLRKQVIHHCCIFQSLAFAQSIFTASFVFLDHVQYTFSFKFLKSTSDTGKDHVV